MNTPNRVPVTREQALILVTIGMLYREFDEADLIDICSARADKLVDGRQPCHVGVLAATDAGLFFCSKNRKTHVAYMWSQIARTSRKRKVIGCQLTLHQSNGGAVEVRLPPAFADQIEGVVAAGAEQ
jgi:hypothetical protein